MFKKITAIKTATVLAALSIAPITYDGRQELGPLFTLVAHGFAVAGVNEKGLPIYSITEAGRKFVNGGRK